MLVRALQCLYNDLKANDKWHFWGSSWPHGDTALFALSSAQVMYAYAMHPESLPASYYKFIVQTGPIREVLLRATRNVLNKAPVPITEANKFVLRIAPDWLFRWKGSGPLVTAAWERIHAFATAHPASSISLDSVAYPLHPDVKLGTVPLSMLMPQQPSALRQVLDTWRDAATRTFPLYLSLSIVPVVVTRFRRLIRRYDTLDACGMHTHSPAPPHTPGHSLHARSATTHRLYRSTDHRAMLIFIPHLSVLLLPCSPLNVSCSPLRVLLTALRSAVQSTSFLASFVAAYMAVVVIHRKVCIFQMR